MALNDYFLIHLLSYGMDIPDSKVHVTNMGPTWVLSAPVGPMLAPWTLVSGKSVFSIENMFC